MGENRNVDLPEELVHDILLRLPVKALLVCKCVCKGWCALIKSPGFVDRHFSRESNKEYLGFRTMSYSQEDDTSQYAFAIYKDHSLVDETNHLRKMPADEALIGAEKGIFLVVGRLGNSLGLWNPATREFKRLPLPFKVYFRASWPLVGFGFDPSTGDFKVVAFEEFKKRHYSSFVYSLSSDSWKKIETDLFNEIVPITFVGIPALNGVKHWIVNFDGHINSILSFNLSSKKFQNLPIPDTLATIQDQIRFTTYCDTLALMAYKLHGCFNLWVMGRDGSWSKSFSIGPLRETFWPLCVWKNEVFFPRGLLPTSYSHLNTYDVSTKRVRILSIPGMDPYPYSRVVDHFIYKESLVSIKGGRADWIQDLF